MIRYQNGNTMVTIKEDGTKIREILSHPPKPIYPESIDVKITNKCDKMCSFCHEDSVPEGKHFNVKRAIKLLSELPHSAELAIGGGNPLEQYNQIIELKTALPELIVNITVNSGHLKSLLLMENTINAVGVSFNPSDYNDMLATQAVCDSCNVQMVVHMIAGVHSVADFEDVFRDFKRILILGYKQYGRGISHHSKHVEKRIKDLYVWLGHLITSSKALIAFDNLAVTQLNPKRYLKAEEWEQSYMGNDGKYTMYLDLVEMQYALNSTSTRLPIGDLTIKEMFRRLNEN